MIRTLRRQYPWSRVRAPDLVGGDSDLMWIVNVVESEIAPLSLWVLPGEVEKRGGADAFVPPHHFTSGGPEPVAFHHGLFPSFVSPAFRPPMLLRQ